MGASMETTFRSYIQGSMDIGGGLGKVVEIDNKVLSSEQARFVRIHVELHIDKSLHRSAVVVNPKGDKVRVGFKYEKLVASAISAV